MKLSEYNPNIQEFSQYPHNPRLAYEAGQQSALKDVVKWGEEACYQHLNRGVFRRQCTKCWAELKAQIKGS